jgi:hypothetical protein
MTSFDMFFPHAPRPKRDHPARAEQRQACCVCGAKPVLRKVGEAFYCAAHVEDAYRAAKAAMMPGEQR